MQFWNINGEVVAIESRLAQGEARSGGTGMRIEEERKEEEKEKNK